MGLFYRNVRSKRERLSSLHESIVMSEPQPNLTPCPYCSTEVLESELYCSSCKSSLPYCVATGYHVVGNDLTACPQCRFPAFRSQMLKLAQVSNG